jgi:LemA protein
MKKSFIIIGVIVLVVIFLYSWGKGMYNGMVTNQEDVNSQWAQVENAYQRRADLIPNLVSTVKGYADFEKQTLTDVITARSKATSVTIDPTKLNQSNIQQFQQAQDGLSSALSRLMVVVEKYPDLKANQGFMNLQESLEGSENRISVERRKFNEAAKAYNISIRQFPRNIFANIYGFEQKAYFNAVTGAEKAPKVTF